MIRRFLYLFIVLLLFISCSRHTNEDANKLRVDSLYTNLSAVRYSNISEFDSVAIQLSSFSYSDNEIEMVAKNAKAYSAMMQMDYKSSMELYCYVRENSTCEIERLVADVGIMTICYRVSANRPFFDYRSSALLRIRRINEEYDYLSLSDKERFNRAKVEFGIVSTCYFSNLAMKKESDKVLEKLESNMQNIEDRYLRLYAKMMLFKNNLDAQNKLSQLLIGLNIAKKERITWLEANYKLLLAITLRDGDILQLFAKEFPEQAALLLPKNSALKDLPYILAKSATDAFERFGDEYMTIEALAVQASCYIRLGCYNEALVLLSNAYDKISSYYQKEDISIDSLICSMDDTDLFITDIDSGVYHISECLLSICREASCAYAGIGDKENSDINRDLYLNLLRTTRLNKHLESRISTTEKKITNFRITAILILFLLIIFTLFLLFIHRRRLFREKFLSIKRKQLLKVCRLLLSSLPHNIDNKQQLFNAISRLLNENMSDFSGKTHFIISEEIIKCEQPYSKSFDITYINSNECDKLIVATEFPIDTDREGLIEILMPYIAVAIEEGMRLSDISDEREKVEEQKRASAIYLAEHKCENILKRVSVSIVSGMRTFIDRISNELKNLTRQISTEDRIRKLRYISELTDKLGDLNMILERWIKTRQGEVSLRIETFLIADLFAIIEKNRKSFDTRGITLIVEPTDCVVKADKALTLFMINTLIDNAVKFTPSGGCITLNGTAGEDFVEISVTDTGIGLSQKDVERILGTKVYDASSIGKNNEFLNPKSKGGGFGLMNCKGIIEKYKKTDSFFAVCSFNISSTQSKGSRFSFRLPKGIMRCLFLILSLLPIQNFANDNVFDRIREFADSVFMCNVNGKHNEAIDIAQEALNLLNSYYKSEIGNNDTLSLHSGKAAELSWWRNSLFQDSLKEDIYFNILDIRNETAVAALALNNWDSYNYNNNIYSTLYRLVHEDKDIADYYADIQQVANTYEVAIAFSCFLILLLLIYYIITFVRHNIIEKTNERLVLEMNSRLLNVTTRKRKLTINDLAQDIVDEIYSCIGETMRIKEVAILLSAVKGDEPVIAFAPSTKKHGKMDFNMQHVLDKEEPFVLQSEMLCAMPLYTMNGGERISVGVIEIKIERPLSENEIISLELISNYLASVAYHSATRVACGYMALEELEEERERIRYEENRLHVQNQVLDNCLSVIKHETIYYPNRIKELSEEALLSNEEKNRLVIEMYELIDYYSSIFGILSNCAIRELDGTSFNLRKIELSYLFDIAKQQAERLIKKSGVNLTVICEDSNVVVYADTDLISYLFKQLLTVAFNIKKDGVLLLRAVDNSEHVIIELEDNRYQLTSDEIAELFTPTKRNIENRGGVNAMEYLVAKEIIRLHEDYTGKHGGRMEARSDFSGTVILFTLPK